MSNENKIPEQENSSDKVNSEPISSKNEGNEQKMISKKKANTNSVVAGVAGVAVGAGGVYVSQVISGDELVNAEVVSASAAGAVNSSSAYSADSEDHASLADFAKNHESNSDEGSFAGMDAIKIGDQNGYVNAILVDSDDDGVFESAIAMNSIGSQNQNTPPAPQPVVNGEIISESGNDDAVNANVNAVPISTDGSVDENALIIDTNNDGVYDSVIELVPVSEVVNDSASTGPASIDESASLPVSHSTTDDMSFSEAFAAAREDVGAGGIFYWHGKPYGTYYENEWNAMSEADKDEYWNSVGHTTAAHDDGSYSEFPSSDDMISDYDQQMMHTNHEDSNDSDPFGSDFDNNANMDDWA